MALDKKIFFWAAVIIFIGLIFFEHTPTGWKLLFKYALRDETTVETVTLDKNNMQIIGYSEPVISGKRYLHNFFVKSDDKYYLLGYYTCNRDDACQNNRNNQFVFQCRGDICLSDAGIAKFKLLFLLIALLSPFWLSFYQAHFKSDEAY